MTKHGRKEEFIEMAAKGARIDELAIRFRMTYNEAKGFRHYHRDAIKTLAAERGLPEPFRRVRFRRDVAYVKRNTPKSTNVKKCLCCGKSFPSEGPGNRICRQCKNTSAWSVGNDLAMAV